MQSLYSRLKNQLEIEFDKTELPDYRLVALARDLEAEVHRWLADKDRVAARHYDPDFSSI